MAWWWSWLLTAVGVAGLFMAGRKRRVGWAIGLGAQVLWIAYAVATRQWGFLVSAGAYGTVYTRNYLAWRRDDRRAACELRGAHKPRIIDQGRKLCLNCGTW